jgi:hypothetical protein
MALVYEVQDTKSQPPSSWAMKQLRPPNSKDDPHESLNLFNSEADLLKSLSHRNIPRFRDRFDADGQAFLVLELISGQPLDRILLHRGAPIGQDEVLNWSVQICDVLDYLHTRQPPIIYRDLKPDNLMISDDGTIKVIDFGIARTFKQGKQKDTVQIGTASYAPPEQHGKGQTDARADIYALGVTMYYLLTNNLPPVAILPDNPVPVRAHNPQVSAQVADIIARAMQKERSLRYQSAADMRKALLALLPALGIGPSGTLWPDIVVPQPPPPATKPSKVCPNCKGSCRYEARFCTFCGYSFAGLARAVLRVVQPYGANWEKPVPIDRPVVIGTTAGGGIPGLDLSFYDRDGYVSRNHARIDAAGNSYMLTDLGSTNGTKLNGVRLSPHVSAPLHNGDNIQLGSVILQFKLS